LQVRVSEVFVNAPVPKEPLSVVVAVSPPDRLELVPHAKPRTVGFEAKVAVILPLSVAPVAVTEEADCVVTVGRNPMAWAWRGRAAFAAMNAQRRKRRGSANFLRFEICATAVLNAVRAVVGGICDYCSALG
jgi:hypothetical protein